MRSGLCALKVKNTICCGKPFRSGSVSVKYLENEDYRYAPVVSKKQGSAVKRNRVKRIIRSIMASNRNRYSKGYYLIYFNGHCSTINREQIIKDIDSIAQKIKT